MEKNIKSGVPQGSILAPLLFFIYINSIGENIGGKRYAFADNFKLYVSYPVRESNVVP